MHAFVTGGSGFVGRQLIRDLVSRGDRVTALARSDAAAAKVESLGAIAARGDLTDEAAMRAAMKGCDAVFHAAAKVEVWGKREDFERDTVRGTELALAAAKASLLLSPTIKLAKVYLAFSSGRSRVRVAWLGLGV